MSKSISVLPVIMAGGSGTRLWPLSRAGYPKQFLVLTGETSLFQQAAERLAGLATTDISVESPVVVGNADHRFLVLEQLRELGMDSTAVVLEPSGRNTAPALTLAALQAEEGGADPVLVVTPADQTVADAAAFNDAVQRAIRGAAQGAIVILGVTPDRPETGYGYIRTTSGAGELNRVAQFVEKPDLATAERYLKEGGYFWNSGMFVLRASVWLKALKAFRPDIIEATKASWDAKRSDAKFVRPGKKEFEQVPAESVDYAVMARGHVNNVDLRMVPLSAGWNDLGAWDAVWQVSGKDSSGNSTVGDVMLEDSRNTFVHSSGRLVTTVGVDNLVVVETADAVLVADGSRSQDVKKIVNRLAAKGRGEGLLHRKVHRPWGRYDSIAAGPRFQVKRIMVRPGASLSLQMHHHRAEHWIVVTGTAEVTCGERKIMLTENQSTYIPLGEVHRLANPGKVDLEIIEVQSGSYLGEDDIVRYEDTYGRTA